MVGIKKIKKEYGVLNTTLKKYYKDRTGIKNEDLLTFIIKKTEIEETIKDYFNPEFKKVCEFYSELLETKQIKEPLDLSNGSTVHYLKRAIKNYMYSKDTTYWEKLYEDNDWLVGIPLDSKAANKYGKGTQWCVTNARYFSNYANSNSVLIYVFSKVYRDTKYGLTKEINDMTKVPLVYNIIDNTVSFVEAFPKYLQDILLPFFEKSTFQYIKEFKKNIKNGLAIYNNVYELDGSNDFNIYDLLLCRHSKYKRNLIIELFKSNNNSVILKKQFYFWLCNLYIFYENEFYDLLKKFYTLGEKEKKCINSLAEKSLIIKNGLKKIK